MKYITLTLTVIIAYILQTTIIQNFNIAGIYPNLVLVVTCCVAFLFGSTSGSVVGFFIGILCDLYWGRTVGLYAIIGMYLGLIVGQFNKKFFKDNYLIVCVLIVLATLICETIIYIFSALVYAQDINLFTLLYKLFLSVIVNGIASIIIYPILMKINLTLEIDRSIFKL